MDTKPPIVNLADVPLERSGHGDTFEAGLGAVGALIGTQKLGCRLTVVPPGKKAWPYHLHHVNEEFFFILQGEGTLRYDGQTYAIRQGDCIAAPTGRGTAHQIINTSSAELRYLAISTMEHPDTFEYPDSNKRGLVVGAPPGRRPYEVRIWFRDDAAIDYWDGET